MPLGPGKYDDEATELRKRVKADGVLICVLGGDRGSGFSAQLSMNALLQLPVMLEEMAKQMREAGPFG